SFTGDAGKGEKNSGENAAIRGWHNDGGDGLPFAGAEGHGRFAQRVRNTAKKFFRAAQGDGNHHEPESKTTGKRGVLPERMNDQAVSKNADDDGRHTVEQVRSITDNKSDGAATEFGKIDGAKKSDRNTKEGSKQQHLGAAEDGVGHAAAGFTNGNGQFGEEIPVDGSAAMNGGEGISGREQRIADHRRIADNHGDGHRFAEGPSQGQENRTKNARAGKRNDHFPCGFPARGPERECGFALVARDGEKHLARDGNDIGDDHDGEDDAGG